MIKITLNFTILHPDVGNSSTWLLDHAKPSGTIKYKHSVFACLIVNCKTI